MSFEEKLIHDIQQYIIAHLYLPLTLPELAGEFSISDFTLKRLFRKHLHTSVHQYIRERRLTQASKLLITSRMPVKQIAAEVGFKYRNAFDAAFKKHFSMSPGQFRKIYS
jgi:AraC-like DNA-binding protein